MEKIISEPNVYICNECVRFCDEVLAEDRQASLQAGLEELLKSDPIKNRLVFGGGCEFGAEQHSVNRT